MNISDKLTPEERELARLLGRPATSEQPGADLDARIMAMANKPLPAPVATAPLSVRRSSWSRRRGVTSSLAVAASLVLVVGLAWQLRPTPPPAPDLHTASADSVTVPAAAPPVADHATAEAADAPSTVPIPAAPAEVAAGDDKAETEKSAASHATATAAKANAAKTVDPQVRAAREAAVRSAPVFDPEPHISAASLPAPPAPAMAPQPSEQSAAQASSGAVPLAESAARVAAPRAAPSAVAPLPRSAPQNVKNAQNERSQQQWQSEIDNDAALSRRHWLKRIRERRDSGDLAGARLSLQRFVQDYPEAHIPRDLRPLLQD
jgi:hypothetical protein